MATKSNRSFLSGNQSPEQINREFIQKPLESAKQTLMGTGLELFNLLSALPDAFIASQRRELKRVKESADKEEDNERVATLEASIAQATQLRTMIERGEARVQRGLGSVAHGDEAFHGFVSNAELEPLAGLTVRITGREAGTGKRGLSSTTDKDGYFRISLGSKRDATEWQAQAAKINLFERLGNVSAGATGANASANTEAASSSKRLAQVEILENERIVLTDNVALPLDEGSVYREYVVAVEKREATKDFGFSSAVTDKQEIKLSEELPAEKAATKKHAASKATKKASKK